jgi:hypothetical protein
MDTLKTVHPHFGRLDTMALSSAPKSGDRVRSTTHEGVFEVVGVNSLMQTANIRAVDGSGPVIANVPWTALTRASK